MDEAGQPGRDDEGRKRSLRRIRFLAFLLAAVSWLAALVGAEFNLGREKWLFAGLGLMWILVAFICHGFLKRASP